MNKSEKAVKKGQIQNLKNFSEVNEFNHEQNEEAKGTKTNGITRDNWSI